MKNRKNTVPVIPFKEAIAAFENKIILPTDENKIILPTEHWADIRPQIHARGFMVTGALKHDLLADIHSEIANDLKNGSTLKDFRAKFDDICAKHGWQPKGGKDFRAKVIYNTNINMAYSSGRWAQMQQLKDIRPYAEYVAILDGKTRPHHRSLHGQVHHIDSAFWEVYYPPNGWYCRCFIRSLNKAEMEVYNIEPEAFIDDVNSIPIETRLVKINGKKQYVDLPKGISIGFDSNSGKSAFGNILSKQDFDTKRLSLKGQKEWKNLSQGDWQSYGLSKTIPADIPKATLLKPIDKSLSENAKKTQMTKLIKKTLAMEKDISVIKGATGNIAIDARMLGEHLPLERMPFISLLKETLEEPYEVWQAFEESKITGKVEVRQRFIKVLALEKNKPLLFVAQSYKGQITGWTYFPLKQREINKRRYGTLIYKREE